jgi:hypothetical protein
MYTSPIINVNMVIARTGNKKPITNLTTHAICEYDTISSICIKGKLCAYVPTSFELFIFLWSYYVHRCLQNAGIFALHKEEILCLFIRHTSHKILISFVFIYYIKLFSFFADFFATTIIKDI